MNRRGIALDLARRGWHVFPVAPDAKLPSIPAAHPSGRRARTACHGECGRPGHGVHDATTDPARIAGWWNHCPTANVGVACGGSDLVVVDLDVPKDGQRPPATWASPGITCGADVLAALAHCAGEQVPIETYTVQTGRGGLHLYFRAPAGPPLANTAGRLGWLVDTRAGGGYVLAHGSVVGGRSYQLVRDVEPVPLPSWIAELLVEAQPRSRWVTSTVASSLARPDGYARAALRNEVQRVLDAAEGRRNATLNRAAYSLGSLTGASLLPEALVREALQRAGEAVGLGPREVAATIASGMRAGAARPRGGGAA